MQMQLTLSVCKRRDAVRLARNEPARPAGAAFGGLSASAAELGGAVFGFALSGAVHAPLVRTGARSPRHTQHVAEPVFMITRRLPALTFWQNALAIIAALGCTACADHDPKAVDHRVLSGTDHTHPF